MMLNLLKRAVSDLLANAFLTVMTVAGIAMSILAVGAIVLVLENAGRLVERAGEDFRMMVYLAPGLGAEALSGVKEAVSRAAGGGDVRFVSRQEALETLNKEFQARGVDLEGLVDNPLPDAMELVLARPEGGWEALRTAGERVRALEQVTDVEYGGERMEWLLRVYRVSRNTGYAVALLFCVTALFTTAATVRLALFSRREEVEIMRLVGATDRFIILPFHAEGILQGIAGGLLGLGLLLAVYLAVVPGLAEPLTAMAGGAAGFLSFRAGAALVFFSGFLGWLGCYLSLKQILA
jgi:cell division transport system permease protein